jgi:hypothetical protein
MIKTIILGIIVSVVPLFFLFSWLMSRRNRAAMGRKKFVEERSERTSETAAD